MSKIFSGFILINNCYFIYRIIFTFVTKNCLKVFRLNMREICFDDYRIIFDFFTGFPHHNLRKNSTHHLKKESNIFLKQFWRVNI